MAETRRSLTRPRRTVGEEEAAEARRKKFDPDEGMVLVWPDLVYSELIAMVVTMILLSVVSLLFNAPLEEPANPAKTPNPSKAPWYFLGLQEMLVYFDPWIAGVVLPTFIILGLMCIPYVDRKPTEGSGYYSFKGREFQVLFFCFGFALWIVLIIIGTYFRGPGWAWYWPWEDKSHAKVVVDPLTLRPEFLGVLWPDSKGGINVDGLIVVTLWYVLGFTLPLFLRAGRAYYRDLGPVKYSIVMFFTLTALALPAKMILRLVFHYKYILTVFDWFNI